MEKVHTRHFLRIAFGITILVLVMTAETGAVPYEEWNRTFGRASEDIAKEVQQTSDSGYVLAGWTQSYGNGGIDARMVKVSSDPRTITVNASGGAMYTRIEDAINAASNGDTITVAVGTYNENVIINKSLSLIGSGADFTIINAINPNDHVFNITVDNVNISRFTVKGAMGINRAGIYLNGVGSTNISNIITHSDYAGIYLEHSSNNTLSGNNAYSNDDFGFALFSSNNNTLRGNNASKSWAGIYLESSSENNMLTENNASDNNYGIYLFSSSNNNTLGSNNVNSNQDYAIYLQSSSNNNILIGNNASDNNIGIHLLSSNSNTLNGNIASRNDYGIHVYNSSNNMIIGNNASNNSIGIYVGYSNSNMLNGNIMTGNPNNFGLYGETDLHFDNQIDLNNIADGKPIYYIKDAKDTVYDTSTNAATVYCINCVNVTVKDMNLNNNSAGIFFWNTTGSRIFNINASRNGIGIALRSSSNNVLSSNNASESGKGIWLFFSNNNILNNSTASSNFEDGIFISQSGYNTLSGNNASNNHMGIVLRNSFGTNTLNGNTANSNNYCGIYLASTTNNILNGNTASNNSYGIVLIEASNNKVNNNIFNNTNNFDSYPNNWNITKTVGTNIIGGSFLGGNFWGKPDGTGFSQTCINTDGDGICDSPYVLYANNTDYLPLTSLNTMLPSIRFINGTVKDHSTGDSLSGVTVSANSTLSTKTNATGFYSLAVINGSYDLKATFDIRYYTNTKTVSTIGEAFVIQDIELIKKPTGNITGSVIMCCTLT